MLETFILPFIFSTLGSFLTSSFSNRYLPIATVWQGPVPVFAQSPLYVLPHFSSIAVFYSIRAPCSHPWAQSMVCAAAKVLPACLPGQRAALLFPLLLLLLSHFSHVRLCATPSLGFSRQEHWSGLPFPSPMHKSEKWKWSRSVLSDSSQPHGLQPTRLLRPWDFPSKSTGVGCHCLLRTVPLKCQQEKGTGIINFINENTKATRVNILTQGQCVTPWLKKKLGQFLKS